MNKPVDWETQGSVRERLLAGLPVTERRLRLNGVVTAVLEGGEGPPLVLLHGPGEYAAKWLRVIPRVVTTHRVIAPDLPGHGASGNIEGTLDVDRVLGWLEDLIECTCSSRPVLMGQILGGAIAARYAADRSDRIRHLVLADALGLAPFQPAPQFGAALMAFIAQPTEEAHDALWTQCTFDLGALRNELGECWEWIKAYNLDRARAPELGAAQRVLMEQFGLPAIPPEALGRITAPTTLIWGRHDLATPLAVAQAASSRYGWPLRVIENAADDPPIEQPEAFLDAFDAALGGHGGSARTAVARNEQTRAAWDKLAPGYDRFVTPSHIELAGEGLRRAGLRAGMRFLDVAAGSGALSIPAARLGARVLATDVSPAMIALLRARAEEANVDIDARVMDGQALDLPDASFDIAGSQFGVMLFPDMPGGIREMVRVVKPGGRVLLHALGEVNRIEFLSFFVRGVQAVRPDFHGLPTNPPPLPLQLQDPEKLRKELGAAGLRDIMVESFAETLVFPTGHDLWSWLVSSNPVVEAVLAALNIAGDEAAAIEQALEEMVRQRAGNDESARLTVAVNIGIGRK